MDGGVDAWRPRSFRFPTTSPRIVFDSLLLPVRVRGHRFVRRSGNLHLPGSLLQPLGLFAEASGLLAQLFRHLSLHLSTQAIHVTAQTIGVRPVPASQTVRSKGMHPSKAIGVDPDPDHAFEAVGIDAGMNRTFNAVGVDARPEGSIETVDVNVDVQVLQLGEVREFRQIERIAIPSAPKHDHSVPETVNCKRAVVFKTKGACR
jgi:hypothetical protein